MCITVSHFLFVFVSVSVFLPVCFFVSPIVPHPPFPLFVPVPLTGPPAPRNNNLTFLRPYYQTEEGDENPFICSSRRDNGMQKCSHIPSRRELRVECTLGWEAYGQPQAEGVGGPGHNACINWNQYYNVCRSGDFNPHNGAINFDNIGYAWIAIFQVGTGSGLYGLWPLFPHRGGC